MCKLYNIEDKEFIIYRIVNNNYVGVTTNLHKRLLKHRSKNKFDISVIEILEKSNSLNIALAKELQYQKEYNCKIGIRNQLGNKNPYAKQVIHLSTGIYYDTIKEACEALGYSYSSVRHYIKNVNNKYHLLKLK